LAREMEEAQVKVEVEALEACSTAEEDCFPSCSCSCSCSLLAPAGRRRDPKPAHPILPP
jgi:hypothetical protein